MIKIVKTYYRCDRSDYKRFKKWLIDNNTKMLAIANKLGVSDSYISAIITGKRNITNETIEKFKKVGFDLKGE